MERAKPTAIDRATALRYMGASGWQPDDATTALLDRAEKVILSAATPRAAVRRLPRGVFPPPELDCGADLTRHLQGCDAVLLMAATLGSQVDSLLRRLELTDIATAAAADALSSVLLEQVCDELEAEWRSHLAAEHLYLTGRYAPGYGDCPLTLQQPFAIALDTVRGWRKLPVFAVGLLCAWQCFYLVTVEQHPEWMFISASRNVTMAAAAVLAVLTVWWAVRSIRRGETT